MSLLTLLPFSTYRRQLEKEGRYEEAATYDFIPTTFMLPREYSIFVEKFKEVGGVWIMKPIGSAQGKGIFMFTRLSEISEWRTDYKSLRNGKGAAVDEKDVEAYVVQRYLQQPLLIGGKKFDMRLYTLVTSFSPLKAYTYRRGFARFTNSRYSNDINDIFKHLTNVAIQKTADNYDERTGGKMELQALKMYLMSRYGVERVDALFWEVRISCFCTLRFTESVLIIRRFLGVYLCVFGAIADAAYYDTRAAGGAPDDDHGQALLRAVR
jgi:tubulin polyglutamylase TTLL9